MADAPVHFEFCHRVGPGTCACLALAASAPVPDAGGGDERCEPCREGRHDDCTGACPSLCCSEDDAPAAPPVPDNAAPRWSDLFGMDPGFTGEPAPDNAAMPGEVRQEVDAKAWEAYHAAAAGARITAAIHAGADVAYAAARHPAGVEAGDGGDALAEWLAAWFERNLTHDQREHYTADGRPRTSPHARGELETVQDAIRGYEEIHGDDWPCLQRADEVVDGALARLASPIREET